MLDECILISAPKTKLKSSEASAYDTVVCTGRNSAPFDTAAAGDCPAPRSDHGTTK